MAESTRLHLGNLPRDVTKAEVFQFFEERKDDITNLWIARTPPGFGFVYVKQSAVEDFIAKYHNQTIKGRPVRIEVATSTERSQGKLDVKRSKDHNDFKRKRDRSRERRRSRSRSRDRKRDESRERRRDHSRDRRRSRDRKRDSSRSRKKSRDRSVSTASSR